MRVTVRGWAVVVVLAASVGMAWQFGPRALNAVVTPLLVVLVAGLLTTARVDRPTVERTPVSDGFVGDRRPIDIDIESAGTVSATVRDAVGDGLSVVGDESAATTDGGDNDCEPVLETILEGDERFSYAVRLEVRGEHRLGPLTLTVSDAFGLVERRFEYETQSSVLVYPHVYDLHGSARQTLSTVVGSTDEQDRTAFDSLRAYQHGDALRDINWNATAKRPDDDLVVTEYDTDADAGTVTVAADCHPGWADEAAIAVATITTYLLEAGVTVGLALPSGDTAPGAGDRHRRDLLRRLAILEGGDLEERQRQAADVLVRADAEGVRVVVAGRTVPFEQFTGRDEVGRHGRSTRGRAGGAGPGGSDRTDTGVST